MLWSFRERLARRIPQKTAISVLAGNVSSCQWSHKKIKYVFWSTKKGQFKFSPEAAYRAYGRYWEILPKHNGNHNRHRRLPIITRMENQDIGDELQAPFDQVLASLIFWRTHPIANHKTDETGRNHIPKYVRLIRNQNNVQMLPQHLQKVQPECPTANHYAIHHWSL